MNLAQKIKLLRQKKRWTQIDLAKMSGISLQSIKMYETSKNNGITSTNLHKLANALNIDTNFLLDKTNQSATKNSTNGSSISYKKFVNGSSMVRQSENLSVNGSSMVRQPKNMSVKAENVPKLSPSQEILSPSQENNTDGYWITPLTHPASAGTSSDIESIEVSDSTDKMYLPATLFKTKVQSQNLRILKVDGYSMTPMLYPDSWVIITLQDNFTQDGLYVINYQNILMVKLLQMRPNGNLFIKSTNKDYDSYEINQDSQLVFKIIGKVLRCII